jgi:hypothetical protein
MFSVLKIQGMIIFLHFPINDPLPQHQHLCSHPHHQYSVVKVTAITTVKLQIDSVAQVAIYRLLH